MLRLAGASTFTQYALSVVAIRFNVLFIGGFWYDPRSETKKRFQQKMRFRAQSGNIFADIVSLSFHNTESGGKVSVYKAMVYTLV